MAIINNRSSLATDPVRNFRFLVSFLPLSTGDSNLKALETTIGFTSVSGLAVTTDSIPYREGGYNTTVHQIPGQTSFQPITLQRGVVLGKRAQWDWMRNMFATVQGGAGRTINQNFRCDLEIQVLPHPIAAVTKDAAGKDQATEDVAMRFHVYNAWPTAIAYSDLNAGDNSLFVEQMTLVHEGFDAEWSSIDATTKNFVTAPAITYKEAAKS
jgi:phage tail-like protein